MAATIKSMNARIQRKLVKYVRREDKTMQAHQNLVDVMMSEDYHGKIEDAGKSSNAKVRSAYKAYDKAHNEESKVEREIAEEFKVFVTIGTVEQWDEIIGEGMVDMFGYENFGAYLEVDADIVVEEEPKPQAEKPLPASVKRPKPGTKTGLVWDICDANTNLSRKEVVELCVAQGVNIATARTQYQRWFSAL